MNMGNKVFSPDGLIELMKQNKSINKNKKTGEKMMCPCSCGEIIVKASHQQAYAQSKIKSHKDNYYNITRGDVEISDTPENKKTFDIMHKNVSEEIALIKKNEPNRKPRNSRNFRR